MKYIKLGTIRATRKELSEFFPKWVTKRLPKGAALYTFGTFYHNLSKKLCPLSRAFMPRLRADPSDDEMEPLAKRARQLGVDLSSLYMSYDRECIFLRGDRP